MLAPPNGVALPGNAPIAVGAPCLLLEPEEEPVLPPMPLLAFMRWLKSAILLGAQSNIPAVKEPADSADQP